MNLVVTGNIGCGKSTVVTRLRELLPEFKFWDVDEMVHELYDSDEFKEKLMAHCGTTDRAVISDMVFANPGLKKFLEDESKIILGPVIQDILLTGVNNVIEFPLYFEMGYHINRWPGIRTITVTCNEETQIKRVKERNGFSDEKIARIRSAQYPSSVKESLADYVIHNQQFQDVTLQLNELITVWGLK